jgi:N-acetylglutamate synthase-like GNAT family acetyltransferase
MTTSNDTAKEPLWLAMERKILEYASQDSSGSNLESVLQTIAIDLDQSGYNVSLHGGNMLQLRWAIEEKNRNGKPLLQDLNGAIENLTFEDVENTKKAVSNVINAVGDTWPKLKDFDRKPAILQMVEKLRLGFLVEKAKELSECDGIRYLIASEVIPGVIIESLGITQERYDQEVAAIAAEKAEKNRVQSLLEAVADKPDEERIKHLINNNVSDKLIIEIAGFDQAAVDNVKKSMEEELKEKQRLAEEAAKRKAEAAAGPSLEEISMEDRLKHIEAIRDIMDLCDAESEIRQMCEQSNVPKCLIDIAISDPDKLDALEEEAEG